MSFNMDIELEKAERNLSVVNATQTFVNKAMKNNVTQKRLRLHQNNKSAHNTNEAVPSVHQSTTQLNASSHTVAEGLKTSIKKENTNQTVFKGINIVNTEEGI